MMIKRTVLARRERGGVSIFIVIFTALLMTIVTTSFIQIMVRNQQQAANSDLSQSAYDAALAGVEDAKRLLLHLNVCSQAGASCTPTAAQIEQALNNYTCDTLERGGIGITFNSSGEVPVGGADDNQAYTCVKIKTNTPSVDDKLKNPGDTKTIPLKGVTPFDRIQLSWYTGKDVKEGNNSAFGDAIDPAVPLHSLPASTGWESNTDNRNINNTPPMLRAQLIQYKSGSVDLSDFSSRGTTNARTAFLYPSFLVGDSTTPQSYFNQDSRLAGAGNVPRTAHCSNATGDAYKCSVILTLPDPEGGTKNNRTAYLQLAALYLNISTSFEVKLFDGSTPVEFDNVQPIVDSTGRASDLFRRVRANVSIDSVPLPVPDAALNVNGDLCKNFVVTNKPSDYVPGCV